MIKVTPDGGFAKVALRLALGEPEFGGATRSNTSQWCGLRPWHKAGIPEDGTAANQAPEADIIIIHYLIAYDCNYMMTYDDSS